MHHVCRGDDVKLQMWNIGHREANGQSFCAPLFSPRSPTTGTLLLIWLPWRWLTE